jgi:hypothetical protein
MGDKFQGFTDTPSSPVKKHFAIVPSDSQDLADMPKAIYCQAAGNIVIRDSAGTDLTYAMTVGQILLMRPTRVLQTGTTGTYYGWI